MFILSPRKPSASILLSRAAEAGCCFRRLSTPPASKYVPLSPYVKRATGHTHTHTAAEQNRSHEHRASNGATTLHSRSRRRRPQAAAQRCASALEPASH